MSTDAPDRICITDHVPPGSSGIRTRCGRILELPPGRNLDYIGVTQQREQATCAPCCHPSNHP